MNNLRFATIIHILVMLEKFKDQLITSEFIAGSINVNPVVVRREIKTLKEAGFIASKKGKDGGCYLTKDANQIKLSDVFQLLISKESFGKKNDPNPECPIGKQMNNNLNSLYLSINQSIIDQLDKTTLKEFSNQF